MTVHALGLSRSPRARSAFRWVLPALSGALALSLITSEARAQSPGSVETLAEFDMASVQVTDPYYLQLFQVETEYLLSLDADRLIAGFRAVSLNQNPASGVTLYGGWEGGWSLLRGHTLGHFLTALAQAYRQTDGTDADMHAEIGALLEHVVSELALYQSRKTNGYLFASPETHFDVVEGRITGDMWVPWYTMHKLIAGLVDVHELHGSAQALQVASKLGDWVNARTALWDAAMRSKVLGVEYGGMNDCLYELYKFTNKAEHLTAAHRFDEDAIFSPISQGTDVLNGKHANTQIPKFIGALNRYRTLGEDEDFYYQAASRFWDTVVGSHTYVTGGNSENEHFHQPGQLDSYRDNINNETCNSYNMLKLSRELFKISRDVKYADFYERAFINEILAAIHPETGMTAYFKPMGTGYFKLFGRETDTFWCCNGTGMENYTKLNDSIYLHDDETLYVNLYVSSKLDWSGAGFRLTQNANVPLSADVNFTVDQAPTTPLTLRFRRPDWLARGASAVLQVNGVTQCVQEIDGYFEVARVWSVGDVIELVLPADVRASRLPDNENAVAFTYGPIVLSAGLGTEQMTKTGHLASEKALIPDGVEIQDTIAIDAGTTIEDWLANLGQNLVQTDGSLEFTLEGTDSDDTLSFTPQYLRYQDRYGIYFELAGEQGTPAPEAEDPAEVWTDCAAPNDPGAGAGGGASGGAGNGPDGGVATGGSGAGADGAGAGPGAGSPGGSGCGCQVPSRSASGTAGLLSALALGLLARRRRNATPPS